MQLSRSKYWSLRQMGVLSAMGLPLWRKRAQQCQSHDLVSPELSGSYTAAFVKCTSGKSILVLASQLASVDCQNLFVKYLGAIGQHQGVELNLESELQSNLDEADGMIVFGDCFTVKLQLNKQQVHASKPCLALASVAFMFENPDYKRQCWQLTKVLLQGV